MANDMVLDEAHQRANLAFNNEMEMLTFYLTDEQLYGINVFKIIEIMECPKVVTKVPHAHPVIKGNIDFRGHPISLFDLSDGLGLTPIDYRNTLSYILVCEYSGTTQGFLISRPNMLINKSWNEIIRPNSTIYDNSYLTAITYHNNITIQILDLEKLLVEILGVETSVSADLLQKGKELSANQHHVLVLDDSKAACSMLSAALEQMHIQHTILNSAQEALDLLAKKLAENHGRCPFTLIVTDLEMPGMDGFTFTRKVREIPALAKVRLAVHSSLSNESNWEKVKQMGADDFIPKFSPDRFAEIVLQQIERIGTPPGQVTTPATQVKTPTKQVETPTKQVTTPTKQVETPAKQVETPAKQVETPTKQVETPTKQVETPTKQVETPTKQVATPTKQVATPTKQVATPTKQVATPTKQVTTPTKQVETPTKQVETPTKQVETPTKQVKTPTKQVVAPTKQVVAPAKRVRTPAK